MSNKRMAGVTLVELVIAIVIVSAALAGLVAAFTRATRASADPVVSQQMLAIGESLMEEIMLKPFIQNTDASATRADFNDIRDFDPIDDAADGYATTGIRDVDGDPIAGLETYSVAVRINVAGVALNSVAAGDALRVQVTVTHGAERLVLTGWKTRPLP
jgi:MSHA pilin protein MshD